MTAFVHFALFIFITCLCVSVNAQPTLVPMSGTHVIPRPSVSYRPATKLQTTPAFKIGDKLTIPAFSFQIVGGGHYQTDVTCRLIGQNCYIFVENDEWNTRVTQVTIDSLARAFDSATARHSDRGIFSVNTNLFGEPPNVDGDSRIIIAIIDVLDSPITGVTFLGYFDVANQAPPVLREIIYIDCRPLDVGSTLARATLSHEFQHMLHWKADPNEDKWLDEGCSEYAELACGYKDTTAATTAFFLSLATNSSLTEWTDGPFDFDQAYLWTTYFVQRYGEATLRPLVADTTNGISSVNKALQTLGKPERFDHLFGEWATALYLDGPGNFGFRDLSLGPVKRDTLAIPTSVSRKAALWGADYLAFSDTTHTVLTIRSVNNNGLIVTPISNRFMMAPIVVQPNQTRRIYRFYSDVQALSITSTSGTGTGYTLSTTAFAENSTSPKASDFDADGQIGFSDFLRFANSFGKRSAQPGFDPTFDLNLDREIGFSDFLIFAQHFGLKP